MKLFETAKEEYDREMKEKDWAMGGLWHPATGLTVVEFLDYQPRERTMQSGLKKIYRVLVDGVEFDWPINPKNPFHNKLLKTLAEKKHIITVQAKPEKTKDGKMIVAYELVEAKGGDSQ